VDVALAIDIGGTKLAAARVAADGRMLARSATPTPRSPAAGEVWEALSGLVDEVAAGDEVVCGVGSGGPMAPGGDTVSPLNIPGWRGFPLKQQLGELTGLPVAVDNDAKALALGEGWLGAGQGVGNFVAMVVSTGVGGGIVLDGRLLDGAGGNAGHIGHVIVEPEGRACACGGQGCLEAEASGTAIAAVTGGHPKDADLTVRRRTGRLVGRAVASVCHLLDLRLALVAGSVALGYGDAFFGAAQEELARLARLEFARGAMIRPGGLGDEGPLVGAAAVGWRSVGHDVGVR
jgi:glucokinase